MSSTNFAPGQAPDVPTVLAIGLLGAGLGVLSQSPQARNFFDGVLSSPEMQKFGDHMAASVRDGLADAVRRFADIAASALVAS